MDYSDRVNSKKGAGGIADTLEANVQTRRRIQELITTQVLDLDNDPYVFRNHLGILECRLCLTTHTNEASYISHLGGRKHTLNLEKRRLLDEKNKSHGLQSDGFLINSVEKRSWTKIGAPNCITRKIRHPSTLQTGIFVQVQYPRITVNEPFFRFMSFYELSSSNQNASKKYLLQEKSDHESEEDMNPVKWQVLVITAEPYDNIALVIPASKDIDRPSSTQQMSDSYWWFWDQDSREFFLQFLFKPDTLLKKS